MKYVKNDAIRLSMIKPPFNKSCEALHHGRSRAGRYAIRV
jgi:hypothetical protein